ncbi:P-loop containing nucleoside triphosphate hydrolase protein [Pisolithus albus]|nr:P-loop containing nucleoside triphosphate hydrolase protein [Pisolithus albus]
MSTRNVVIVGESGVGKSSLINLILGEARVLASNDAVGVTLETTRHPTTIFQHSYYLWDTPGLNEGTQGSLASKRVEEILRNLLMQLDKAHGVHLLVICFRGTKVTRTMQQTYMSITGICSKVSQNIPVAAVITELEKFGDSPEAMEVWWENNQNGLSAYGMDFAGHACITTLTDECHPPTIGRYRKCQLAVHHLIQRCSRSPKSTSSRNLNVVLFEVARVSPDANACTLDSDEYVFEIGPARVRMWDTVGLEEPDTISEDRCFNAIEKAIQLIKSLSAAGGISLLLFCIRANRITVTIQNNYRLFYEVLGRKEVPVALVVTHLEREQQMEDWWPRNEKMLERYGIITAGHACITGVVGHSKYQQSQEAIRALLLQYDEQGKFMMPSEAWIGRLLKGLVSFVGDKAFLRGRDMVRILTKRCHLRPDVAQRVAACLDQQVTHVLLIVV